jgi:hypothetical protein
MACHVRRRGHQGGEIEQQTTIFAEVPGHTSLVTLQAPIFVCSHVRQILVAIANHPVAYSDSLVFSRFVVESKGGPQENRFDGGRGQAAS